MKTALVAIMLCMFSVATVVSANETSAAAPTTKHAKGTKLAKAKKKKATKEEVKTENADGMKKEEKKEEVKSEEAPK